MKLRNKKTGEIRTAYVQVILENNHSEKPLEFHTQSSIAELNEEWEDVEEPKKYWYIDADGNVMSCRRDDRYDAEAKSIGNYFETKEEAELAVERLRAWKRLKDEGAEFYGWRRNQTGTYELYLRWEDRIPRSYEVKKDLDLLFGGEE